MIEAEFGAKAAQAHALLAELAAFVSSDTSATLAVEVLPEILAAGRQADLLTCRLIERADRSGAYAMDGAASTNAFVRGLSGESDGWVSKRVQVGRALADRMPVTAKAFEAGDLGLDHAWVIQQATKDLQPDLAEDLEAFLAQQAAPLTPRQLRVVAEELVAAAAPEESADQAASKRAAQHLNMSETLDGRWRIDGWFDAEAGLIVSKAIAEFLRKPDPEGDLLTESIGSRRAEALVQLARHACAHAEACNGEGGGRHNVIVGLSHQGLLDGLGTAGTPDGQRLPAAAARRMACDAGIIPAVFGSDSEILDTSAAARAPSPAASGISWSLVTVAAPGRVVTGHLHLPKRIIASSGSGTTAKPNPKTSISSAHTIITRSMKAAGKSPSAPTQTALPGSGHPTADHPSKATADHSYESPGTPPHAPECDG
jgi:Domain of unknown function (DUF222)